MRLRRVRRPENMASEHRRRQLRVCSANDPPVREARDDLLKILMGMDFGEPALAEAMEALRQVVEYNLPGGKRFRLLAVVQTYELMAEEKDAPHLHLACLVGWCVELLQSYILVVDDIMDGSSMRRGQPCWHTRPDVGLRAINDAVFLGKALGWVLRQRLRSLPCYLPLLELFHEADLRTVLGQELDMVAAAAGIVGQKAVNRYWATVTLKTAFYSFALPVRAGMLLAGVEHTVQHEQAQEVALALGRIFQVRDDYIDCFGTVEDIGKVGTDIVDRKCSWLLVTALQLASPQQAALIQVCTMLCTTKTCPKGARYTRYCDERGLIYRSAQLYDIVLKLENLFTECFSGSQLHSESVFNVLRVVAAHVGRGAPGGSDEAVVKAVYKELDLPGHYAAYRERALRELNAQIDRLPPKLADVFRLQTDALLRLDS